MFSLRLAAWFLGGAHLHLPECFMTKFEKFLWFAWPVPSRSFSNGLPQFLPFFLPHFILALGPHVPFCDEFHINIVGELLLFLGVGTDAVLNAHAIDSTREGGVESRGEFFYFFEEFVLLGEDLVNVITNRVKKLVVLETVLLLM